jgi:hypothetical protein
MLDLLRGRIQFVGWWKENAWLDRSMYKSRLTAFMVQKTGPIAVPTRNGEVMLFISKLMVILTLVVLSGSALGQSTDEDQRDFWFLNNTGKVVVGAYVSPHNRRSWGPDSLGSNDVLADSSGILITFDSDVPTPCIFDFKLIFVSGEAQQYVDGINLCKYRAIEFKEQTAIPF